MKKYYFKEVEQNIELDELNYFDKSDLNLITKLDIETLKNAKMPKLVSYCKEVLKNREQNKINNIYSSIKKACEKHGYSLINQSLQSNHPDDWYLYSVLAYDRNKCEWVAWGYNATDDGLFSGYYTTEETEATKKYNSRINL